MKMALPAKIAGGNLLDCGHYQVLSAYRLKLSAYGQEQSSVWCVECQDYTRLAPYAATVDQADYEAQQEARWNLTPLEIDENELSSSPATTTSDTTDDTSEVV
jgi:hypothetical protein